MATAKETRAPAAPKPLAKPKTAKPAAAKKPAGKAPTRKAAVKKTPRKTAPPSKTSAVTKAEKAAKPKKPKLVRDSFTIPKTEYEVLGELKQRANKLTRPAKKSELLRAGIMVLAALSDAAFLTALEQVPAIKTGRPAAGK